MAVASHGSWRAVVVVLACSTTCVDDDDGGPQPTDLTDFATLIDHTAWEVVPAGEDPLVADRPTDVDCEPDLGWYLETDTLEVDTTLCNYVSLRQPTRAALEAGMPVHVGAYHLELTADEPAEAHIAILIDGQLLWEEFADIPDGARIWDVVFDSPISAPAGAELVFHLHNHGANHWTLQDVSCMAD